MRRITLLFSLLVLSSAGALVMTQSVFACGEEGAACTACSEGKTCEKCHGQKAASAEGTKEGTQVASEEAPCPCKAKKMNKGKKSAS